MINYYGAHPCWIHFTPNNGLIYWTDNDVYNEFKTGLIGCSQQFECLLSELISNVICVSKWLNPFDRFKGLSVAQLN